MAPAPYATDSIGRLALVNLLQYNYLCETFGALMSTGVMPRDDIVVLSGACSQSR